MQSAQTINASLNSIQQVSATQQKHRWLCIRFTHLALNLNHSLAAEACRAIVVSDAEHVWQCNAAAMALGVDTSMSINQMQLLTQHNQHLARDQILEQKTLNHLAQWAIKFTPNVCIYSEDSLLLDVGRSLKLFGGIEVIAKQIKHALRDMAFDCRLTVAHTPKAAYLLSLNVCSELNTVNNPSVLNTPLSLLQTNNNTIKALHRCGFENIADIADIPYRELGSRFGSKFVEYLEQVFGSKPDPQGWITLPPAFEKSTDFAQPISNSTWIEQHQRDMLFELVEFAKKHNFVYLHMAWSLALEDGRPALVFDIEVNAKGLFTLNSEAQTQSLYELTALKQERINLKQPIVSIKLNCDRFVAAALVSRDLFDTESTDQNFQDLKNKLVAKLGHTAVLQLETRYEIAPEDKHVFVAESKQLYVTDKQDGELEPLVEPVWVFEKPKPLSCKNEKPYYRGELVFIHGANRIVSQWWAQIKSRDYYMARQQDGQILWIYYDRVSKKWFLHGLFG